MNHNRSQTRQSDRKKNGNIFFFIFHIDPFHEINGQIAYYVILNTNMLQMLKK